MKRIALLFIAAMLVSAPAFAAGASQSATVTRDRGQALQSNIQNQTDVTGSTLVNAGERNTMDIGGVSNQGGVQANVMNKTRITGSTVVNAGKDNQMRIGTVRQGD